MTRLQKVILGGDPAQLPPVVVSQTSQHNSLGSVIKKSALQRIQAVYPHFSRVELNENYRGHHSTFVASSKIFYDGKMIAGGDPARWNTTLATTVHQLLSNQDFAGSYRDRNAAIHPENRQLFINLHGISEPEPNGTSYYNPNGVMVTAIFVQMLVDSGVKPKEIGVISMYSEDVRRIRQELAERGIQGVEVSTVDGYQGSEKEVMVVHFVAAIPDRQDRFAFVKRPQRLNVASTRARQYQFLIGNTDCWMHWQRNLPVSAPSTDKIREFMAWVHEKGQIMDWVKVDNPCSD
ncbi:DNA-binding protein SMUBP-2 [Elasticomyces elasticus]|nr:DNA-binding protein SMUBP-2 [Elasticomyces elasticus]